MFYEFYRDSFCLSSAVIVCLETRARVNLCSESSHRTERGSDETRGLRRRRRRRRRRTRRRVGVAGATAFAFVTSSSREARRIRLDTNRTSESALSRLNESQAISPPLSLSLPLLAIATSEIRICIVHEGNLKFPTFAMHSCSRELHVRTSRICRQKYTVLNHRCSPFRSRGRRPLVFLAARGVSPEPKPVLSGQNF